MTKFSTLNTINSTFQEQDFRNTAPEILLRIYQGNGNVKLSRKFKYDKFSTLNTINSTFQQQGFQNPAPEILLRIYQGNINVKLARKFKYEIIKEM